MKTYLAIEGSCRRCSHRAACEIVLVRGPWIDSFMRHRILDRDELPDDRMSLPVHSPSAFPGSRAMSALLSYICVPAPSVTSLP